MSCKLRLNMLNTPIKVVLITTLLLPTFCCAKNIIKHYIPDAQSVGQGRLSVLFWDIYDATLYAPQGQWTQKAPFALEIIYLKSLTGEALAQRSIAEMRAQGLNDENRLSLWHNRMQAIFPDVHKGIVLTGVYTQKGATVFYHKNRQLGTIQDPEFGPAFFGIWLSEKTSEPDLRRELLGLL